MPDSEGRYARAERDDYKTPPCPICGSRTIQEWTDVGKPGESPGAWWRKDEVRCASPAKHPA